VFSLKNDINFEIWIERIPYVLKPQQKYVGELEKKILLSCMKIYQNFKVTNGKQKCFIPTRKNLYRNSYIVGFLPEGISSAKKKRIYLFHCFLYFRFIWIFNLIIILSCWCKKLQNKMKLHWMHVYTTSLYSI
jgi:hypothetical protein